MRSTWGNTAALDQLLERYRGKVGRGFAIELSRRRDNSRRVESLFTPVLTNYTAKDESSAETRNNGYVQTNVSSQTKGVSAVIKRRLDKLEEQARIQTAQDVHQREEERERILKLAEHIREPGRTL